MKKIMFNDKYGLTQAVLEGRKKQTRRIVPESVFQRCRTIAFEEKGFSPAWETRCKELLLLNSNYSVGEVVSVAQKYSELEYGVDWVRKIINKAHAGWNNKMFVSGNEMPHHIRITNIRVERLQDISDEDCLKEGVIYNPSNGYTYFGNKRLPYFERKNAYASLIDMISGRGTWKSNPYVFVYDFELVD